MSRHFEKAEGLFEHPDEVTHEYLFNQTMLRIKDPNPAWTFILACSACGWFASWTFRRCNSVSTSLAT